jgi:hypothetical protein
MISEDPTYSSPDYFICCQKILSDLEESFLVNKNLNINTVEEILVKNLSSRFSKTKTSEMVGISLRTIRKRLNYEYGA